MWDSMPTLRRRQVRQPDTERLRTCRPFIDVGAADTEDVEDIGDSSMAGEDGVITRRMSSREVIWGVSSLDKFSVIWCDQQADLANAGRSAN